MAEKLAKKIRFGVETDSDLLLSTVRLPFGNKTGALLNIYNSESGIDIAFKDMTTVPGVMVFDLVPTIGRNNASLNTYMGKLYARLVRKISGAKDIEKCDQFMYIEIGKSCVDLVCKLKTIYELAFMYKEYNLYWPKGQLYSLGVDADNIAENLEDFRSWINRFISRLRSFNFPNLAYLKSGWEYGRTILVDSPDLPRAQSYIFNLAYVYEWDPISDPNGTLLRIVKTGVEGDNMTFNTIKTLYNGIVDTFAYDQDFIDISAWYDHLYENNPDGLLKFTDCTETMEHVQVTCDQEALTVVENIEFLPYVGNMSNTFNIYQLSNELEQNMAFDISAAGNAYEKANLSFVIPHICNCHKTKVTEKDVAKYITFKYGYSIYSAGRDGGWPISCAMFVDSTADYCVVGCNSIRYGSNGLLAKDDYRTSFGGIHNIDWNIAVWEQYTNKPFRKFTEYTISSGQYQYVTGTKYQNVSLLSDLDNYIEISNAIMRNFHSALWFTNLEDK